MTPDDPGSSPRQALHIERHGDGPPLVLLHGWAMHGGVFASLLPRLARDHTVHLVDLPGHGRSRDSALPLALEAVVAAIAARVPRAIWCGWSLGGLFALHAAATRPQAVRGARAAVREPALRARRCAGRRAGNGWRYGMSPEIFRDFATGLRDDYRGTLDRFLALEAFGSDDARGELRALRAELFARGEPAAHVLADGLRAAGDRRPARRAAAIDDAEPVDRRSPRPAGRPARDARRGRARADVDLRADRAWRTCAVPHPCR